MNRQPHCTDAEGTGAARATSATHGTVTGQQVAAAPTASELTPRELTPISGPSHHRGHNYDGSFNC